MEHLTLSELRDEYTDDLVSLTDATLARRVDSLTDFLEEALGHSFGRAARVRSSAEEAVTVNATGLMIGEDSYLFAQYTTLGALAAAVGESATRSFTLLPHVDPALPASALKARAQALCGPGYSARQTLDLSGTIHRVTGNAEHRIFLPLDAESVNYVIEDSITLVPNTDYTLGESWLVRWASAAENVQGRWKCTRPDNIIVSYKPVLWGRSPGPLREALLEAFALRYAVGAPAAEAFGDYSYSRAKPAPAEWFFILTGPTTRAYGVKRTRY